MNYKKMEQIVQVCNDRCTYTYFNNPVYILQSDINECTQGIAGCDHHCINTPGSFYCTCLNGFELFSDNRSCAGNQKLHSYFFYVC